MAGMGAFFDAPMGAVQREGEERDVFIGLTKESTALGERLGIRFREDPVAACHRCLRPTDDFFFAERLEERAGV